MFRPCLVLKCKARKQTAPYMQLLCKTRIEIWQIAAVCVCVCVWVRNAIKIAAALSASNHEKECCCFLSHCPACRRFVLSCCENTSQAYIKDIRIGAVLCCKRRMSFFMFMKPKMQSVELNEMWMTLQAEGLFQIRVPHILQSFSDRQSEPSLATASPASLA